jgi:hypothetical protein
MTTVTAPSPSPTPPPTPPPASRPRTGLRITGIVLAGLSGIALLGGGGLLAVDHTERDADGYFTSKTAHVMGSGYAISSQRIDLSGTDDVLTHVASKIRVTAQSTDGKPVFVGIARDADVDRYLAGVARSEVSDIGDDARVSYKQVDGRAPAGTPGAQRFWDASVTGTHSQRLVWKPRGGDWAVVVMHADGSRGIKADVRVAAKSSLLRWGGWGVLGGGLLLLAGAGGALVAARRPRAA